MAGHPQNSPRGLFVKTTQIDVDDQSVAGNSTGITVDGGIALSAATTYITQNSTAVKFPTGIALSNKATTLAITQNSTAVVLPVGLALSGKAKYFTANSTATLIIPTVTAIPSARVVGGLVFVSNSTGKMLAYHSTGATWKYLNKTAVLA